MATTFKTFLNNDQISSRTLLHEAIPLTGTIMSGTYADLNVKTYSHGMFTSYFDYPYLSSSANHILDITAGYSSYSNVSASNTATSNHSQLSKKVNIYNQMAQVLMGHDVTGTIRQFDEDGDLSGGTKMDECIFVNFSRLLVKDEIKKGSFMLSLGVDDTYTHGKNHHHKNKIHLKDTNAQNEYRINSPAGEYGILYATEATDNADANTLTTDGGTQKAGLIFYQAGVAVITASVFTDGNFNAEAAAQGKLPGANPAAGNVAGNGMIHTGIGATEMNAGSKKTIVDMLVSSSINDIASAVRQRITNVEFNNTTELNSSIYFCRVNNNDFNYSANPTYLSSSKIVVKDVATDEPTAYITSVGLYSSDNELLAVAKLSEPLKKTPSNEFTLRVRLDY
tara:strand:- start:852 stop:2036 length:1185 start_codon:yes stop_codon:yes gene_type:complete